MGNKKKLVSKGLVKLFPDKIKNYYEPFAGSAVIAMNTKADTYYINDSSIALKRLYFLFATLTPNQIIAWIEKRIEEFDLPKERTKRNVYANKEKIEEYKKSYIRFRDFYNQSDRCVLDFYTLMLFSFSQQFRFNSKGDYNMPFGNDCFTEKNKGYIVNGCNFFVRSNVNTYCKSFDEFLFDRNILYDKDAFVYFDPPYANTTAVYNESQGTGFTWNDNWELKLREMCKLLTQHNIKFAMSNVFANKQFVNTSLQDWCVKNNFNVHHFNHSYTACGKGNANTDEVLIMNY